MKNLLVLIATLFIFSCSNDTRIYRVMQSNGSIDFLETEETFKPGDSVEAFIAKYGVKSIHVLTKKETWRSNGIPAIVTVLSESSFHDNVKTYQAKDKYSGAVYEVESPFELRSGDEMFVKRISTNSIVVHQVNGVINGLMKVRIL
jgi:hypothetical protein